jgi:hypothetical protein
VEIKSDDVDPSMITIKIDKIDKYGKKKIRFSIQSNSNDIEKNVKASISINM